MKFKTEIEVTPEEIKKLIGTPEYNWLNEAVEWTKKHNPFFVDVLGDNGDPDEK